MDKREGIKEISWQEASVLIEKVNKPLYQAMSECNPGADHKLFLASYSFGAKIMEDGRVNLPLAGKGVTPISDANIPQNIRDQLDYNLVPLGIILNKKIEVFKAVDVMEERIIPVALLSPGLVLGNLEVLEAPVSFCARHVWDAVAGGRSLYVLPKVTNTECFDKLRKEFGLRNAMPRRYIDHWEMFKGVVDQDREAQDWQLQIIFLGKQWLQQSDDTGWLKFMHCLQKRIIVGSAYYRNQLTFGIMWQYFAKILAKKRLRPNTYLFDTLKHLVAICTGAIPGFRPLDLNEELGPIDRIKQIFLEIYGVQYAPTILGPCHFDYTNCAPVYYSLQVPTLLESMPKFVPSESLLSDLIKLRDLMLLFLEAVSKEQLHIQGTTIEEALKNSKFEYFHIKEDKFNRIKSSAAMPESDHVFLNHMGATNVLPFAANSKFLQGCVKIHT